MPNGDRGLQPEYDDYDEDYYDDADDDCGCFTHTHACRYTE
jgi:hypothetical protein